MFNYFTNKKLLDNEEKNHKLKQVEEKIKQNRAGRF